MWNTAGVMGIIPSRSPDRSIVDISNVVNVPAVRWFVNHRGAPAGTLPALDRIPHSRYADDHDSTFPGCQTHRTYQGGTMTLLTSPQREIFDDQGYLVVEDVVEV